MTCCTWSTPDSFRDRLHGPYDDRLCRKRSQASDIRHPPPQCTFPTECREARIHQDGKDEPVRYLGISACLAWIASTFAASSQSVRSDGFEPGALNVLIGANGAGKSNFIDLFRMLGRMADRSLQIFVAEQDGPDTLLFGGRRRTKRIEAKFQFGTNDVPFSLWYPRVTGSYSTARRRSVSARIQLYRLRSAATWSPN